MTNAPLWIVTEEDAAARSASGDPFSSTVGVYTTLGAALEAHNDLLAELEPNTEYTNTNEKVWWDGDEGSYFVRFTKLNLDNF